ncbi:hypothetical protein CEXT_417651 [Caerostris extrusa]|uniref:Uncharacterized protein n=1 Tax=Caerostris extrusa TaxID=172846 RepID=A0AAV4MLN7_CAEEX|nr:hypothetical protein CEXT_417651 [Caerostris extrusa]
MNPIAHSDRPPPTPGMGKFPAEEFPRSSSSDRARNAITICMVMGIAGFYGCPNPTFLAGFGNFAERVNFKEVPLQEEGILLLLHCKGVCYRVDGILKRGEIRAFCARGGSA